MTLLPIAPSETLYIKLGQSGEWERECIIEKQTLRLGYREVPHELCLRGEWDLVLEELKALRRDVGSATRDTNQIRHFYEADETVLWVTFFGDHLFWAFSHPQVTLLPDRSKTRKVMGGWLSADMTGKALAKNLLSGKLLAMQGFRGTICSVKESEYLIRKINGQSLRATEEATVAQSTLEQKIETLLRLLHWKDFEILVDLIFRQAGWQRVSVLGETEKTIDLDLLSPITSERFAVQVKSKSNLAEFERYQQRFGDMQGYRRLYFVVHTPANDLLKIAEQPNDEFQLWLPKQIARLTVRYGLADWVIAKSS